MAKKLLLDVHAGRTKVALVDEGELIEFHIERAKTVNIVGNIYKGKVVNILAGMQAAFVNIGLEKNAFLYVGDMLVDKSELVESGFLSMPEQLSVKEGDSLMVQVVKDQIGTKGARVSHSISLPGRLLVLMPFVNYIGISKKITDNQLREKLDKQVSKIKPDDMGFIVRTAAAKATAKEIKADADNLINLWNEIQQKYSSAADYEALHYESDLIARAFRDIYNDDITEIVSNDDLTISRVERLVKRMQSKSKKTITKFPKSRDLFYDYNLADQVDNMLSHKVWLPCGAYLVIDKTEALTVIDVNTGKYVGDNNLEETVFHTNMLAAAEIAKQIRLRNIGGIIVCDFIDMETDDHRDRVLEKLDASLKRDRIKSTVIGMSGLGLVEITRKKTRNEVSISLLQNCPYCSGDGYVYSFEHIVNKIKVAMINALEKPGTLGILIIASSAVVDYIFRNRSFYQYKIESWGNYRIYFSSDYSLQIEKYRIREFDTGEFDLPRNARLLSY